MHRYRLMLVISMGVILTTSAFLPAAPPPELGKWWKDSSIAGQLHLTESQVGQIEQCFLDHRMELATLNSELKRHEADLRGVQHRIRRRQRQHQYHAEHDGEATDDGDSLKLGFAALSRALLFV